MDDLEHRVVAHYTLEGMLDAVRDSLREAGADPDRPTPADLAPFDQLHTGGHEATEAFLARLDIGPGTRVLDIGCGIGGVSRHVAALSGARVTGVDLTPGFIEVARALSRLSGMEGRTVFHVGSALDLPLPDGGFDLALMIHVGMNIADKARLFAEAARVLAPGGCFALFDVMRGSEAVLSFPFPWAEDPSNSFLEAPATYRALAADAGFARVAEHDRTAFAIDYFSRAMTRMQADGGRPPAVARLMMRGRGPEKIANYLRHARAGDIAPVEMIFRAP